MGELVAVGFWVTVGSAVADGAGEVYLASKAGELSVSDSAPAGVPIKFAVGFPMFAKIAVTGADKHPLYQALTAAVPAKAGDAEGFRKQLRGYGMTPTEDPEVLWNFEKFLIGRDGAVIGRFAPTVAPDDTTLVAAIETALAG